MSSVVLGGIRGVHVRTGVECVVLGGIRVVPGGNGMMGRWWYLDGICWD